MADRIDLVREVGVQFGRAPDLSDLGSAQNRATSEFDPCIHVVGSHYGHG